jgi:hypothetical protein
MFVKKDDSKLEACIDITNQIRNKNRKVIHSRFNVNNNVTLCHGDCMNFLKTIPNNSIRFSVRYETTIFF